MRSEFEGPFIIDAGETTAIFGIEPTPWDEVLRSTLAGYASSNVVKEPVRFDSA